jgi:hypothetical protein
MGLYRDGGRVTVAKTAAEAHDAMITDWWQAFSAGESAVMLAHRRVEVDRLNELAHAVMAAAGRLTGDSLVNDGRQFRVGDRVVCGVNRLSLGISNGTQAWITALDTDAHTLTPAPRRRRRASGHPASLLPAQGAERWAASPNGGLENAVHMRAATSLARLVEARITMWEHGGVGSVSSRSVSLS